MVKRSLAAANAIRAGNTRQAGDIENHVKAARKIGSPEFRAEKPNNRKTEGLTGTHQRLAIRQASAAIASSSARQTSRTGVSTGSAAGAFLAAATAASGLRIRNTTSGPQTTKAPELSGAFDAC